jgi:tRNA(Arg) A34 adenosine deaminase TadA
MNTRTVSRHCSFELPAWVGPFLAGWQQPLSSVKSRMQLAIALSRESVGQKTGGPFGAVVVDERDGKLVSVGVNLVTTAGLSIAHAEMVALSLAQTALGQWNLSRAGELQLVTSCEPCAMCYGALPWSGIASLICGARKKDAEAAGFDEGDKPGQWIKSLQRRGISVQRGILRKEAAAVLAYYHDIGGPIYNADHTRGEAGK